MALLASFPGTTPWGILGAVGETGQQVIRLAGNGRGPGPRRLHAGRADHHPGRASAWQNYVIVTPSQVGNYKIADKKTRQMVQKFVADLEAPRAEVSRGPHSEACIQYLGPNMSGVTGSQVRPDSPFGRYGQSHAEGRLGDHNGATCASPRSSRTVGLPRQPQGCTKL